MYWMLHWFRRLCEGQEGHGQSEARPNDTEPQKTVFLGAFQGHVAYMTVIQRDRPFASVHI